MRLQPSQRVKDFGYSWLAAFDWDSMLSYETKKMIVIKDRYLGALKFSATLGVIVYFVIVPIMFEKAYLKKDAVSGWAEATLREPEEFAFLDSLPYCSEFAGNQTFSPPMRLQCSSVPSEALIEGSESSAMFVAVHVREESRNMTCLQLAGSIAHAEHCTRVGSEQFFAQPEQHKIVIDHGLLLHAGGVRMAADLHGRLECEACASRHVMRDAQGFDVLNVSDVLQAAGMSLDGTDSSRERIRSSGTMLMLEIRYEHDWFGDVIEYEYRVTPVAKFAAKRLLQPSGLVQLRSGIKVMIRQTGSAGSMTVVSVLTLCVAASQLMRISTIGVDLVLSRVMPLRDVYCMMKWEESVDFSDFRDGDPSAVMAVKHLREMRRREAARGRSLFGTVFQGIPRASMFSDPDFARSYTTGYGPRRRAVQELDGVQQMRSGSQSDSDAGIDGATSAIKRFRKGKGQSFNESVDLHRSSDGGTDEIRQAPPLRRSPRVVRIDEGQAPEAQTVDIQRVEAQRVEEEPFGDDMVYRRRRVHGIAHLGRELLEGQEKLRVDLAELLARVAATEVAISAKAVGEIQQVQVDGDQVVLTSLAERFAATSSCGLQLAAHAHQFSDCDAAEAAALPLARQLEYDVASHAVDVASHETSHDSPEFPWQHASSMNQADVCLEFDDRAHEVRSGMEHNIALRAATVGEADMCGKDGVANATSENHGHSHSTARFVPIFAGRDVTQNPARPTMAVRNISRCSRDTSRGSSQEHPLGSAMRGVERPDDSNSSPIFGRLGWSGAVNDSLKTMVADPNGGRHAVRV